MPEPAPGDWDHNLTLILPFAVAIEIHQIQAMEEEARARFIRRHSPNSATVIGSQADQLLQRGDEVPQTFAALARGIACLAHAPRGVTIYGRHYCVDHTACPAGDEQAAQADPHTRRHLAQLQEAAEQAARQGARA